MLEFQKRKKEGMLGGRIESGRRKEGMQLEVVDVKKVEVREGQGGGKGRSINSIGGNKHANNLRQERRVLREGRGTIGVEGRGEGGLYKEREGRKGYY